MKNLLIILLLLPAWAWAGTEVIDPDSDVRMETGWTASGCASGQWECLSDDNNPDQIYILTATDQGNIWLGGLASPVTADSTIDSVGITLRLQVQNLALRASAVDSIAGQTADYRVGTAIGLSATGAWEDSETVYTLTPDGNAYTWTDISNYFVGVEYTTAASNNLLQCTEIWITVYYSYAEAPSGGGNLVKILE